MKGDVSSNIHCEQYLLLDLTLDNALPVNPSSTGGGTPEFMRAQALTNIPYLFEHTAEKTFSSYLPHGFLGCSLTEQGQILSHLQLS